MPVYQLCPMADPFASSFRMRSGKKAVWIGTGYHKICIKCGRMWQKSYSFVLPKKLRWFVRVECSQSVHFILPGHPIFSEQVSDDRNETG